MNLPKSRVVFSAEELNARIKELGAQITADLNDGKPIVCVCVLRGAVLFFADLMKYIDSDQVVFDFVTLCSYENALAVGGNMQTTGKIKLIQDMRESVEGKHVLVVEDIVDSGNTVAYLRQYFENKNAIDVKIACLLDKPMTRKVPVDVDYVAFTLERPAYIIGYGLDDDQKYRNLNAIYEVVTD